jgi:hypothetical protein
MPEPEPQKKVISEPYEVTARLAELGVPENILRHAAEAAITGYNACTPHHPRPYAGLRFWAEAIKDLRDSLVALPFEWRTEDDDNLPFVVNKAGSVAIMVATGDAATGKENEEPCTNSSKGPRTKEAVDRNEFQFSLFPNAHLMPEELEKHKKMGRMTFLLLMHRDVQSKEVRCELSRPKAMDETAHVNGWIERIILKPLPFTGPSVESVPHVPKTPEIDVPVKKRA